MTANSAAMPLLRLAQKTKTARQDVFLQRPYGWSLALRCGMRFKGTIAVAAAQVEVPLRA